MLNLKTVKTTFLHPFIFTLTENIPKWHSNNCFSILSLIKVLNSKEDYFAQPSRINKSVNLNRKKSCSDYPTLNSRQGKKTIFG